MSLFLTKLLTQLIYPLNLALLGLVIGVARLVVRRRGGEERVDLAGRSRLAGVCASGEFWIVCSLIWLWLWSTPAVSTLLCASLEGRYSPVAAEALPKADVIIVPGGCISPPAAPRIYADLNGASSRLWHAARLYRAGRAPLVVVSSPTNEAAAMQAFLIELGIPAAAIEVERASRTTFENALFTRRLLRERGVQTPAGDAANERVNSVRSESPRILLVTSAQHMRRAALAFTQVGFDVIPAATNYQVTEKVDSIPDFPWLPDAGALSRSTAAFKEYVGYWVYLLGWEGGGESSNTEFVER